MTIKTRFRVKENASIAVNASDLAACQRAARPTRDELCWGVKVALSRTPFYAKFIFRSRAWKRGSAPLGPFVKHNCKQLLSLIRKLDIAYGRQDSCGEIPVTQVTLLPNVAGPFGHHHNI